MSNTTPPINNNGIVAGTKHKRKILEKYKTEFSPGFTNLIVTRKKGKHCKNQPDDCSKRMAPLIKKHYQVNKLTLYIVITTVMREYLSSFTLSDRLNLALVNKDFSKMIPNTVRWLGLVFSALRDPCLDYKQQSEIDQHRGDIASAAMIHFGLDLGKFVWWLGGEYTSERRNVRQTLASRESC